jgi:hypothetical protein
MNKEKLIEMGLTEEQATKVMQSLDGAFIPKHRFDEVNNDAKAAKAIGALSARCVSAK